MTLGKLIAAAAGASSLASAFSLYDTAPMVGVPESQAPKYSVGMRTGYDTNPYGTTDRRKKDSKAFVSANISASYADRESRDAISYRAHLGGTHYLGTQKNDGKKYYSDSSLEAEMSHAFSMRSRYSGNVHLSYQPEPGYDNGVSSAGMRGDTLSWNWGNTYSEAMDARWSWNLGLNLSGTKYGEKSYAYDDRQYYGASLGLSFRESDRLTYTASASYRDELRSVGMNSQSIFTNVGLQYALDPVSSCSFSGGAQNKMMGGRSMMNPTLNVGYRRRVADGLSMNAYVSYSDENVDNYNRATGGSYRSTATWRVGAYGTYILSPDVSFEFRVQAMQAQYRQSTNAVTLNSKRATINPAVTMKYAFTNSLHGSLGAHYTYYHYERGSSTSMYARVQYSAGLSYHF